MINPLEQVKGNKVEETKSSVQPAQEKVQVETQATPTVLLSQTDAYIHERIKAQPKTLTEIDVKVETEFNPNHHRLTLPKELDPYMNKYTFHWIYKKEQAISEACDVKGWIILNRSHFSELPKHLFSVTGSVERGDMILGFMKNERAEKLRKSVSQKSTDMVKSRLGAHKGDPNYYVPKDKSEDDESSSVIGL